MKNFVVIFGAMDPEAVRAQALLNEWGIPFLQACSNGNPVHPGNAYESTGCWWDLNLSMPSGCYLFECGGRANEVGYIAGGPEYEYDQFGILGKFDHHNPGDPGFGKGPKDFWLASSLGQMCQELNPDYTPTEVDLYTAASDHCIAAAYRGECPGIDPQTMLSHRAEHNLQKGQYGAMSYQEVILAIQAATTALNEAPEFHLGGKDMRGQGMIVHLPEAALRAGEAYISEFPEKDRQGQLTGKTKIAAGGHLSHEMVTAYKAWMRETFPGAQVYGDAARGFCGCTYIPAYIVQAGECGNGGFAEWRQEGKRLTVSFLSQTDGAYATVIVQLNPFGESVPELGI